ncbi:hypothetical protein V7S43_015924 [Phytophthora oleae]|uniref:PARP-type domain-containing protein n=1 Tax=Phytophthora oleae TaxID=2107226 RepID=A0ABD3EWY1_9STRA
MNCVCSSNLDTYEVTQDVFLLSQDKTEKFHGTLAYHPACMPVSSFKSPRAAKKLCGQKRNAKIDKGDYKVGDLDSFTRKMAQLLAKESARNDDELVVMMHELIKETLIYRTDVERSGLSLSPAVGNTARALRKHMMNTD